MCVLAGTVGDGPAAPVLLEMLEREEGLYGGYYTGLATVADGTLHVRKVVGDVAKLRSETDAAALPGSIGIAHSRTPSGGDVEWGHPFVDCQEQMAYVAQGSRGFFKHGVDMAAAGDGLLARGHRFRTASSEAVGGYPVLSDGTCVHISDLLCHAIAEELAACGDRAEAMRQAFMKLPGEVIGLTVHQHDPDRVAAVTVNQSLVIGRDASAVYMASCGLAFPDGITWRMALPSNTAAAIGRTGIDLRPFGPETEPVNDACPTAEAEALILQRVADEPGLAFPKACSATKALWPASGLCRNAPMAYDVAERLVRSGRVGIETARVPGMFGHGTAPQARLRPADRAVSQGDTHAAQV